MMKVMVMVMVLMLLMLVLRMLYIVKQKQLNSFLLRVKKLSWEDELAAYNGGQVSQHFEQPKTSSISTSLPKLCTPPYIAIQVVSVLFTDINILLLLIFFTIISFSRTGKYRRTLTPMFRSLQWQSLTEVWGTLSISDTGVE